MKYFGLTDEPIYLTDEKFLSMARLYWGVMPLPKGATLLGGYSDNHRAGALIRLSKGMYICGNAGAVSNIIQPSKHIMGGE